MGQDVVFRRTVTVDLENGLHLVPCSRIAQIAASFDCDVHVHKDQLKVDGKTVLDLMTLNANRGTMLVLEARGDGADEVIARLVELFDSNFDTDDDEPSS